jgi:hypothetical protein
MAGLIEGCVMRRASSHLLVDLARTYEEDRYRGLERRSVHLRALHRLDVNRPSPLARSWAALSRLVRRDRHSITSYPCRLPDGKIGRTAIIRIEGSWTATCAIA